MIPVAEAGLEDSWESMVKAHKQNKGAAEVLALFLCTQVWHYHL